MQIAKRLLLANHKLDVRSAQKKGTDYDNGFPNCLSRATI